MSESDDDLARLRSEWIDMDIKHANRTDEEINDLAAKVENPKERKEYRKSLKRLRRDAQRDLLNAGANAMLHHRPIDDHRVRFWLFEYLNQAAKARRDKRTETDSMRQFHIAKWVEQKMREGDNEVEATVAIGKANNLSQSRVANIYQDYRRNVQSHWDEREQKVVENIENLIADGWTEANAIAEIYRLNELTESRVNQVWRDNRNATGANDAD